jgi:hypothetical protein
MAQDDPARQELIERFIQSVDQKLTTEILAERADAIADFVDRRIAESRPKMMREKLEIAVKEYACQLAKSNVVFGKPELFADLLCKIFGIADATGLPTEQTDKLEQPPMREPTTPNGRSVFDAIGEADTLLKETLDKLDPDNERDSWFMVRVYKVMEALADCPFGAGPSPDQATPTEQAAPTRDSDQVFLKKDGNQWCAHRPSFVSLQESFAGFGDTPDEAVIQLFKHEAATEVSPPTPKPPAGRDAGKEVAERWYKEHCRVANAIEDIDDLGHRINAELAKRERETIKICAEVAEYPFDDSAGTLEWATANMISKAILALSTTEQP